MKVKKRTPAFAGSIDLGRCRIQYFAYWHGILRRIYRCFQFYLVRCGISAVPDLCVWTAGATPYNTNFRISGRKAVFPKVFRLQIVFDYGIYDDIRNWAACFRTCTGTIYCSVLYRLGRCAVCGRLVVWEKLFGEKI